MDGTSALRAILDRTVGSREVEVSAGGDTYRKVPLADWILARLAEQGYVLVNVEGLAAALEEEWEFSPWEHCSDNCAPRIFAYLKDDAHSA